MPSVSPAALPPLPDQPRVTVITVCKDVGWCIEHCVRSVLEQDYPDIEYLVHDAASRDNTVDVLRRYEDRAQWISEPDRGPIDAFHKALARATGDIVCMLMSDERFSDPGAISRIVEAFRRHPDAGAIYGDFRLVDTEYRETGIERKRQLSFEDLFCFEDFISPCAAFVRMATLREDGRLKPDLRRFFDDIGDYGLWIYVGARHPLTYVPGIVADYMVHPGAISYGLEHCQVYIRECESAIGAFQTDRYSPAELASLKQRALARLYVNFGNLLSGQYVREPLRLAWKGVRKRPRLLLSRVFWGLLFKSSRIRSLLPVRAASTML
jgi:glycosyltransferase involved in cell wall biosynthesis